MNKYIACTPQEALDARMKGKRIEVSVHGESFTPDPDMSVFLDYNFYRIVEEVPDGLSAALEREIVLMEALSKIVMGYHLPGCFRESCTCNYDYAKTALSRVKVMREGK